ncbi:hypothetical protein QTP88_020478 [Uroleucon formosanum]
MTFTVTGLIGFLMPASGRLTPYVLDWPHRLTTATLTAYVNKTFGPLQRCLKVAADDTDEAAAIVAMLHPQRDNDSAGGHLSDVDAPTRTLALDAYGDVPVFCTAYMVIGRRLETIEKYFEYFRSDVAERMLVVVVQNRKYIKPFIKVSSTHVLPPHQITDKDLENFDDIVNEDDSEDTEEENYDTDDLVESDNLSVEMRIFP